MSRLNVLILGSESCGKTTFLNNCMNRDTKAIPTIGINIDFTPTIRLQEITGSRRFEHIINTILKDDGIDVVVFLFRKGYTDDLQYIRHIYNQYFINQTVKYILVSTHHDISYKSSFPKKCEVKFEREYIYELHNLQRLLGIDGGLFTVDRYGTNTKRFMEKLNEIWRSVIPQQRARCMRCLCW